MAVGNYFAALQVARLSLRGRKLLELRILTVQDGTATQLLSFTKVMTSDFLPRTPSFPDTLELRKLLTAQVCTPEENGAVVDSFA